MKYLLFIAMVTNVFGAGTVERDGRHFFSQVVSGRKDDAASMEEAVDTMPSLMELLTGLTSSALSRLLTIETLENVVDALPMGTLYNRARNTNFSRLREDPSETSAFLAQVLLDALEAANGPENLPAPHDMMKLTIKMYIEVCVALFQPTKEDMEHPEQQEQLKTYIVRALSRGSSGEIRGLTQSADGQTLLSPRSTLSVLGWTLSTMPNFGNNFLIILQRIPIQELDSKLQKFDSSPESTDDLANFLTGVGMDLLNALEIPPTFFTERFYLEELITMKIQLGFALYDLLEGKPINNMEDDLPDGEAVVKRLILNALL